MQRCLLSMTRFCLSAWMGIAVFFVVVIVELRQSELFGLEVKDDHPKVLFPIYYAFEFALLIPAFLGACAGTWNTNLGRGRRIALLQLVVVSLALAAWDFGLVYQRLAEMMSASRPYPPEFHSLHRMSLWLNGAMLCACSSAALLAHVPEKKLRGDHDLPASPTTN